MIVGLGNPGLVYQKTRHNLGWMVLKHAAARWNVSLTEREQAFQGQGEVDGHRVVVALPLIWMNQTGQVIASLLEEHRLAPSDLILVYDDLDIPLGRLKIKTRGGAGGHNGVRSVLVCLDTEKFCRLKVGIGRPMEEQDLAQYVLSPFLDDEQQQVEEIIPQAVDALECVVTEGASTAMNRFHTQF